MMQAVKAGPFELLCDDAIEIARARSYATKEPGTLTWLADIQSGQTVYDVGANIGLYTLAAAAAVGRTGHVYAFEPHLWSATSLLRNVRHNGFADRVDVLTCALGEHCGLAPFQYTSKRPGSSGHQLGAAPHVTTELKSVLTLDYLMHRILLPDWIKIDVDGQEAEIIRGGHHLLTTRRPVSVQVEVDPARRVDVDAAMTRAGYVFKHRHFTAIGQAQVAAGLPPESVIHNAVFEVAR